MSLFEIQPPKRPVTFDNRKLYTSLQLSRDGQKLHEVAVVFFYFECRGKTKNLRRKKNLN